VHVSGPSMPGCTIPGDVVPGLRFSGVVHPRVTGLGLPRAPGSPYSLVDWGQVENSMEQACSRVAAVDRLL
jgi:hypothetical protein